MEPVIVERDAFRIIGMRTTGRNEHGEIPRMWDEFLKRVGDIRNRSGAPDEFYGVCTMPEGLEPGAFEYIAGVEVCSLDEIPEGMAVREIPAATYAVETAHGLADIRAAYERIFKEWLPTSGYEYAGGADFEYYTPAFQDERSDLYIHVPVKPAA